MRSFALTLAVALTAPAWPGVDWITHAAASGSGQTDWPPETMSEIRRTHPFGVMGAAELVYMEQLDRRFLARVDTGATSSSIDAQDIETFERDGEQWVRFVVPARPPDQAFEPADDEWPGENPQRPSRIERPVVDKVLIERSDGPDDERYVVELSIVLGEHRASDEFTLNDRREFHYGVLLGRSLLGGMTLVDPGRRQILGEPEIGKE